MFVSGKIALKKPAQSKQRDKKAGKQKSNATKGKADQLQQKPTKVQRKPKTKVQRKQPKEEDAAELKPKKQRKSRVQPKQKAKKTRKRSTLNVDELFRSDEEGGSDYVKESPEYDAEPCLQDNLDVSGLLPSQDLAESQSGDDMDCTPPLIIIIKEFISSLSTERFCQLVETWKQLAMSSTPVNPLMCGSGCTGSGMDWHVIKALTEAPSTYMSLLLSASCWV